MFERELFRLVAARTEAERPGNAVGAIVGAAKNVTARTAVTRAVRDMAAPHRWLSGASVRPTGSLTDRAKLGPTSGHWVLDPESCSVGMMANALGRAAAEYEPENGRPAEKNRSDTGRNG